MTYLQSIGNTPCLFIDGIYVKLECSNPGGSVKDRIGHYMIREAARRGELRPGDTIVETTSGNTGIALSIAAREMGYRAIIFMPEHMSIERRRIIEGLGAEVRLTPKEEGFEGAVARRDTYRGRPGYYVPDQFSNLDNTHCHCATTGAELVAQLDEYKCGRLDWFVAGVGTGGTLMGVAAALEQAHPGVQVAAVEPDESAVMSGDPAGDHGIMGIGDGFIPSLLSMDKVDRVVRIKTEHALAEANRIRQQHGYCVGISAGANTLAALQLRDEGAVVATLWPDCADRYASVGLEATASADVQCPFKKACAARTRAMLGDEGGRQRSPRGPGRQDESSAASPNVQHGQGGKTALSGNALLTKAQ